MGIGLKIMYNFELIESKNCQPVIDLVINHQPKNIIFFNGTEYFVPVHFCNYLEKLIVVLKQYNTMLYIVLGGIYPLISDCEKFNGTNIKIIQWSTYILHWGNKDLINQYGKDMRFVNINKNFEKLFVSYNRRNRLHRCIMMDLLKKHELMNYGKISWLQPKADLSENYTFKYWNEKYMEIDINNSQFYMTKELEYINVFLNLVVETSSTQTFVTEKTYKSLLIGQPFICFGGKNQNKVLEQFGFKLYTEIFDYDFDSEDDLYVRAEGLVMNIIKIKDKNYYELYDLIKEKIQFNKKRILDILKYDEYIPEELVTLYNDFKSEFNNEIKRYGNEGIDFSKSNVLNKVYKGKNLL